MKGAEPSDRLVTLEILEREIALLSHQTPISAPDGQVEQSVQIDEIDQPEGAGPELGG